MPQATVLRVSSDSYASSVAGAITGIVRNESRFIELAAVGCQATQVAIAAIKRSNEHLKHDGDGFQLAFIPTHKTVNINGDEREVTILAMVIIPDA